MTCSVSVVSSQLNHCPVHLLLLRSQLGRFFASRVAAVASLLWPSVYTVVLIHHLILSYLNCHCFNGFSQKKYLKFFSKKTACLDEPDWSSAMKSSNCGASQFLIIGSPPRKNGFLPIFIFITLFLKNSSSNDVTTLWWVSQCTENGRISPNNKTSLAFWCDKMTN